MNGNIHLTPSSVRQSLHGVGVVGAGVVVVGTGVVVGTVVGGGIVVGAGVVATVEFADSESHLIP